MKTDEMQLYLFYDGTCALCRRFADVVERWDVSGSIGVIDLANTGLAERFPEIDLEAAVQELTVSEPGGQVFQGSQALQRLTQLLPGIRSLTWAYRLPGVVPSGRPAVRRGQAPQDVGDLLTIGDDHTALNRTDVMRKVETEGPDVAVAANPAARVLRTERLATVLDDP